MNQRIEEMFLLFIGHGQDGEDRVRLHGGRPDRELQTDRRGEGGRRGHLRDVSGNRLDKLSEIG